MNVREMYEEGKFKEIIDHYADSVDSDRDLFYSAHKSITFAFVPGYDSGTDVKEGE